MILEINGIKYQGFTSASVRKSIDQISGSFSFSATSDEFDDFPVEQFSECKIYIGNELILTGFVDIIDINYNFNSHDINIQGRDKTSILIDSSVWDKRSFNNPINFLTILNRIISDLDSDIEIINNVGTIEDFKKMVNAQIGESAFDFINRLAAQRQILLSTNGDGNLVLTRGASVIDRILTILLMQKNNFENNILSANITFDTSKRFRQYKVLGQSTNDSNISNKNQTLQYGTATDLDALVEKKLIINSEEPLDLKTASNRAKWESNIRRARSLSYKCQVQGHEHLTGIWEINKIVRVVDDYANIDSDLLIKSVDYILDNNGSFTNLELVRPDAYSLNTLTTNFDKDINAINF